MKRRYLSNKTGKNTHETLPLLTPASCCDASQLFSFSFPPFVNFISFSLCISLPSPFSTRILEYIDLVVHINTVFLHHFFLILCVCSRIQQLQDSLEQTCMERIQYEAEFKVSPWNEVIMNKWTALKRVLLESSICSTLQQNDRITELSLFPCQHVLWRLVLIKLSLFPPHESVFLPVLIDNSIDIWPFAWRRFHLWSLRWSTCLTNCTCLIEIQSACLCASIPVFQKVQASYRRFGGLDWFLPSLWLPLKAAQTGERARSHGHCNTDWWDHLLAVIMWRQCFSHHSVWVFDMICHSCTLAKIIWSICLTCSRNCRNMCHLKIHILSDLQKHESNKKLWKTSKIYFSSYVYLPQAQYWKLYNLFFSYEMCWQLHYK